MTFQFYINLPSSIKCLIKKLRSICCDNFSKRFDAQEMFMRPPEKVKKLLRVKIVRNVEKKQVVIFGNLHPQSSESV